MLVSYHQPKCECKVKLGSRERLGNRTWNWRLCLAGRKPGNGCTSGPVTRIWAATTSNDGQSGFFLSSLYGPCAIIWKAAQVKNTAGSVIMAAMMLLLAVLLLRQCEHVNVPTKLSSPRRLLHQTATDREEKWTQRRDCRCWEMDGDYADDHDSNRNAIECANEF